VFKPAFTLEYAAIILFSGAGEHRQHRRRLGRGGGLGWAASSAQLASGGSRPCS
jgi:hypothetical protein